MKIKPLLLASLPLFCACSQGVVSSSLTSSQTSSQAPSQASSSSQTTSETMIENKVQVVVLLGQSNMEGASYHQYLVKTMGQDKVDEYTKGYDDIKISYSCAITLNTSDKQFVPVKLGQGSSLNQFGPEVGIAEVLNSYNLSQKVYLIKFAYGGTTLNGQWRSPSSQKTGSLYTQAVAYINEQIKLLESMDLYPEINAICWMQGESDAEGNGYASYYDLQKAFINDLRKEFLYYSNPNGIGFVDAYISDSPAWVHYQEVNAAKQQIADEDDLTVVIDTISEGLKYNAEPTPPLGPDPCHYDSSSMIKLGNLFAQELLKKFLNL